MRLTVRQQASLIATRQVREHVRQYGEPQRLSDLTWDVLCGLAETQFDWDRVWSSMTDSARDSFASEVTREARKQIKVDQRIEAAR